jgi:hypothetical protein
MDELIEMSRNYFLRSHDTHSRIWLFSDEPSAFLQEAQEFGDESFHIFLSDPYRGRSPLLLNYDAFARDEIQIGFRPTAILDSNVVAALHQFVSSPASMESGRRDAVRCFLRFACANQLDYNPFFYYMESAAKDEAGQVLPHVMRISRSILRLHTMNVATFVEKGDVVQDQDLLQLYAAEFGGSTLDEISENYARSMVRGPDPHVDGLGRLIYAALLKIGLIHRLSRKSVEEKYGEFLEFMGSTLNIALGPERMLAAGFFSRDFEGFIPLQRGARLDRVLNRVRSAAWDLILLHLPAYLLGTSSITEVVLGFPCTADRILWRVANAYGLVSVMKMEPDMDIGIPATTCDLEALGLDPSLISRIVERDKSWSMPRIASLTSRDGRISYDGLTELIMDLERQADRLCCS